MAAAKKRASSVRKKKKRWFGIVAPAEFNGVPIGETLAQEPQEVVGRSLKVNLSTLNNDFKRQNVNIRFMVESVNNENAQCKTVGYEIIRSQLKRMVRKGTDKMDDSF